MLASVRDLDEARIVLDAGVDLIDLKQPADGALGALPPEVISEVVGFVAGRTLTSATAGNIEPDAEAVQAAMQSIAAGAWPHVLRRHSSLLTLLYKRYETTGEI